MHGLNQAGLHTQPPAESPGPQIIAGLGVDVPELRQARACWQAGRFDDALQLFEAAVTKYRQNLLALVDASRAFGARFEITKAEEMLDRLTVLGKKNPQVLHVAGQSYRMIFRPEKALACFERVLAMNHRLPDTLLEMAVLYERRHRLPTPSRSLKSAWERIRITRKRLCSRAAFCAGWTIQQPPRPCSEPWLQTTRLILLFALKPGRRSPSNSTVRAISMEQ